MKKSLLIILCTLMSLMSWAQNRADGTAEPYAVLKGDTLLTFYYDDQKATRNGMDIGPFSSATARGWHSARETITSVVFDDSFANYDALTSMNMWFYNLTHLTSVTGISNLNTANVTSFRSTFSGCSSLTSLDLSSLNTSKVMEMNFMFEGCSSLTDLKVGFSTESVTTMANMFLGCSSLTTLDLSTFNTSSVKSSMDYMFSSCSALTTIYVSDLWTTTNVTTGNEMFNACQNLVGGQGTSFSASHRGLDYAHIDGGENNPGYFTDKNAAGTFDIRVSVYGNGEVSVGNLPDVIVDGKSAVASVDAGGSLEMFFFPLDGYQIGSVVLDNNDVTAFVMPATEYSAASYILNDINASHDITVTFTAKEGSGVVAPEFRFEGDNLTMSTTTQNASIFYKMAELASMDEAYVDSVKNSLVVTADAIHSTYYEQPFELKKNAVVKAIAVMDSPSGMVVSDTTTMVYDYEAWLNLKAAVKSGVDLYDRAKGNPNVDAQLLEDLQWALNEGDMIYNQRAQMDSFEATHFTKRINELCAQIEAQMAAEDEPYAVLSDNNTKLTFYYDKQKASRGGMSVGPFGNDKVSDWYSSARNTITSVVFDDSFANCTSLTSTAYWFEALRNLTTITGIGNLKTDNVTDMSNMFLFCESLTSLDVAGFKTSNVVNMENMFYGCSSLTSLDVSNFNTSNVTNMDMMFQMCSGLTSLDVSNFNTSSVTRMLQMFCQCSSLTKLTLGNFNTDKVTVMSGLLNGCSSLTEIDLSSLNTSSVESLFLMFDGCTSLKTLDLSNFNTARVTNMVQMFRNCTDLTTIYVGSGWTTSEVTNSDGMFTDCTSLVGGAGTVYDANHFDHTYAHIDGGENNPGYFTDIDAPISVVAPEFRFEGDNLTMSTTTQNASIFYKMAELASMDEAYVDSVKNSLVVTADAIHSTYYEQPFELKKNAVVKAIAVMDGPSGMVVSDTTTMVYDYEAWMNLREAVMKGVDLYDRAKGNPNVDAQLLEDLQWALNEGDMIYNQRAQMDSFEANHFTQRINELCAQIEAQMAAEDEPYAVLSTDGLTVTFYYDTQKNARGGIEINNSYLQENVPSPYGTATTAVFDASFANYRPVSTAHWFQHCRSLTSITNIEYLNTVNVTEMTAMFHKCSSLSSLNLSNFNTSNVTDMTAMFGDCSGLTSLDLSNFNTTNVTGMNGMFAGCSGLTNIDLSNFNTTNVMDMSLMFHSCSGLTSLDLSNFNTAKVTNMVSMFRYCSELKTIYIGNEWSTNAVEFGSEMFDGCTNLVGGAGTVYDANHTDHTYAHIDGGENNPGYFTDKNPVEASYYDHVLYVGGSVTLAEAMQKFGTNKVVETIAAIVWNSSQAISTSELQVITNPNLLIYVQDASLAPANRDNVVINGFAKNVVLSDVTSGNNNFYCPEEFTAEAISYTRNFQQQTEIGISRGWESIALPFDVQTIMHEKNGVLSPFGSSEGGKPFWLRQLSDNGLVQAIEIHANRPYLISMPNCTEYPAEFNQPGRVTFSSLNVRVPVTEEETVAMADSTIVLIPTFQRMEQSDWIYALNVGETRAQYLEGSVFEQGLRAVRPFEAFTVHNNNQSNPAPRYIAINEIGNGTTGIENIVIKDVNALGDRWYSLDGRLLQGKPAQKGIYIHNGKKKIIK